MRGQGIGLYGSNGHKKDQNSKSDSGDNLDVVDSDVQPLLNSEEKKKITFSQKLKNALIWMKDHPGQAVLYAIMVLIAGFQAVGSGTSNAYSVLRGLPSVGSLSLPAAQALVTSLCILGSIMNLYVMYKLLPATVKSLYEFFKPRIRKAQDRKESQNNHNNLIEMWKGMKFDGNQWVKEKVSWPRLKTIGFCSLLFVAFILSIAAGFGIGAFVAIGAPAAFIGLGGLFSNAVIFPSAVAIIMGVIQGMCIAALLFKSAMRCMMRMTVENVKGFFTASWWPTRGKLLQNKEITEIDPKNFDHTNKIAHSCQGGNCHCLAKARIKMIVKALLILAGLGVLVYASVANIIVEGDASNELFKNIFHANDVVAELLTTGIIFIAGGLLNILLCIDTAAEIFKPIGNAIGELISKPQASMRRIGKGLKNAWANVKEYAKAHPVKFTLMCIFSFAYLLAFIGNTIVNFASSSFGVAHSEGNSSSYADMGARVKEHTKIADGASTLSQENMIALQNLVTTPQASVMEAEHINAGLVGGFESASTIAYMSYAFDKEARDAKKKGEDNSGLNVHAGLFNRSNIRNDDIEDNSVISEIDPMAKKQQ